MKDKHITTLLIAILGIVFIGGAINHYSPDVCPHTPTPTTPSTGLLEAGRLTQ